MTSSMNTRIAGERTAFDWNQFKARLVVDGTPELWMQAYREFFCERLESRYFAPIELLRAKRNAKYLGEGFAIMAIQCSLIEFLESTVQGKTYRFRHNNEPPLGPFEYTNSSEMFTSFLKNRQPFSAVFDDNLAVDFYKSVRCGLLHETRTKGQWVIRAGGPKGVFVEINASEKILYRNRFQDALREFVKQYKNDLLASTAIQAAFIRKLDSLCI